MSTTTHTLSNIIVVKYGGAAMVNPLLKAQLIEDLVSLSQSGQRYVLVHGGGPEINIMLNRLGIAVRFERGLRCTDSATMEVVQMVLAGKVNKNLVAEICAAGGKALGLSGQDGMLLEAEPLDPDLGCVGSVTKVNTELLFFLLDNGYIPVIATIAVAQSGNVLFEPENRTMHKDASLKHIATYNINADSAAAEIAAALGARQLYLLTDVPGVLRNPKDPESLIPVISREEIASMVASGAIMGGMIPKLNCCIRALDGGVERSVIMDGRRPGVLKEAIFNAHSTGTVVK